MFDSSSSRRRKWQCSCKCRISCRQHSKVVRMGNTQGDEHPTGNANARHALKHLAIVHLHCSEERHLAAQDQQDST